MFERLMNWKKQHQRVVSVLEASTLVLFFLVVIAQFAFLGSLKVGLPKLAEVLPAVLVLLTNEERSEQALNTLETNRLLELAAQAKANDMAQKEYFSHVSPEGLTPWFWLDGVAYPYIKAGENLAVNFIDSEDVHQAWLDSPTHKANIVSAKYKEIGIATAQGKYKGKDAIYIVQFFGTQKAQTQTQVLAQDQPTVPVTSPPQIQPQTQTEVLESAVELEEYINRVRQQSVEFAQNTQANPSQQVLGAQLSVTSQESVSETERLFSAPRTIFIFLLLVALFIVVIKLSLAIHLRHSRLIATLFTLLVLIAILLYINNAGFFIGETL